MKFRDHKTARLFWSSIIAQKFDVQKYYKFIRETLTKYDDVKKKYDEEVKDYEKRKDDFEEACKKNESEEASKNNESSAPSSS